MKKFKNRYIIVVGILIISAILMNFLSYEKYDNAQAGIQAIKQIPIILGQWKGHDFALEEIIYEILETKSIIHRNYTSNNGSVFLSIVYYPQTKVDFHAPEGCLAGKGIQISKTVKEIVIDPVDTNSKVKLGVNQLIRQEKGKEELIYYFYRAGDFVGPNYIKLRLALALNKFTYQDPSGALIRCSTPFEKKFDQSAQERLKQFIELLYPLLIKYL